MGEEEGERLGRIAQEIEKKKTACGGRESARRLSEREARLDQEFERERQERKDLQACPGN